MGAVCTGSHYGSDWAVYTAEDRRACEEAGGQVTDTGGGVCGSTAAARMAVPRSRDAGRLAELSLAPFRDIRARAGQHPLVARLVALNDRLGTVIAESGARDPAVKAEIADAYLALAGLAAATGRGDADASLPHEQFARMEALARRLAEGSGDADLRAAVSEAVEQARRYVGRPLSEVAGELFGHGCHPSPEAPLVIERTAIPDFEVHRPLTFHIWDRPKAAALVVMALEWERARAAIERKARELGWVGDPVGDLVPVAGGWRRSYAFADIYVGNDGAAHEVHGDIRAKYNALGGPAALGLPVTDETGTPDGIGRFNHFTDQASIYWTPSTGPMMVRGRVRQAWADAGWERGPVGYPVADHRTMPPLGAADHPNLGWCVFENGAMFSVAGAGAQAVEADISPDDLRMRVRSFFDERLHAKDDDLGLEAQTDLVAVGGWGYGFWHSAPRTITYRLHGFYSVPILPDPTFTLEFRFRFGTAWPMLFTYPTDLSLIVTLEWLQVNASGVSSGELSKQLFDGIWGAFWRGGPDPDHPEVPDGSVFLASFPTGASQRGDGALDVIDVITTAQGGLKVLLNPLPPVVGGFRKLIAQNRIDAFLGK